MQSIRNFESLFSHLNTPGRRRAKVAVVCPHDDHTCGAISQAADLGIADLILVGDPDNAHLKDVAARFEGRATVVAAADPDEAARTAVAIVRRGEADVLMKGLINTDNLLRAVLDKENGILPRGRVLTHLTVAEIPQRDKLLFFTDVAVIPYPTLEQREAQVRYMADLCHKFGIVQPLIAMLHCTEKTSKKFPVTLDYAELRERAAHGEYGKLIIDGPMDVKTAVDPESGAIKGIESPVCGNADAMLFPDIQAGNVFYKTITCFGGATNAGMLAGAQAPVVLASRGDSIRSKLCSLAMACLSVDGSHL